MRYLVINGTGMFLNDFQDKVEVYLKEGWKPLGPPQVIANDDVINILQAITLEEEII